MSRDSNGVIDPNLERSELAEHELLSLRDRRKSYGYTLIHVARELNITYETVTKVEQGLTMLKAVDAVGLARVYEVDVATLIHGHMKSGGI